MSTVHEYFTQCGGVGLMNLVTCIYCGDVKLFILERIEQTVSIDATTVDIEEKGVKLRLTVVDTPGFGDAVDNRQW